MNPFDPNYVSQLTDTSKSERRQKRLVEKSRTAALTRGAGWGNGTILMPKTPKRDRPADMVKTPTKT
jgi:hypothetical protein